MANTLSFFRSSKGQVIPDTTLNRRFNMPFSVGEEVPKKVAKQWADAIAEATESRRAFVPPPLPKGMFPLYGPGNVLEQIDLEKSFERGQMRLQFSKDVYGISHEGKSFKTSSFSLFSDAAKMACPSFSLPAGPLREGGTCAAAGMNASSMARPARGLDENGHRTDARGNTFVCDACYATSGNYWYASTSMAQAARLEWCMRKIGEDPSGRLLGMELAEALEITAREATYRDLSTRMGQELGVWDGSQILVPGFIKHRGVIGIGVPRVNLPPISGFRNTAEYFMAQETPAGAVAGFFRIHDSGDLNVGMKVRSGKGWKSTSKVASWKAYLYAWTYVAQQFPHVRFWIPVRVYRNEEMRAALQEAAQQAPNLVIRASPLFIDGDPPRIEGISASAVNHGPPRPDWYPCPVGPSDKSSCSAVGCRACWISKDLIPSYQEH